MDSLTILQIRDFVGGQILGEDPEWPVQVGQITTNSKEVRPGALFVAIRGETHDGHAFLPAAASAGAVAALVDTIPAVRPAGLVLIKVPDTRVALGQLGSGVRAKFRGAVIGVGGSNGKTSAKHLIDSALCQDLHGTFSPKSFNNDIGVPLAIFPADPAQDYLVLEIGTNHPGEIRNLTLMARPDIAVITNCSEEHLEGLGSIDGVRREEASLIEGLNPNGLLVVNGDDPELLAAVAAFPGRKVTFGESRSNDLFATDIRCGFDGVEFKLNGKRRVYVPLMGRHTAINALTAIAVARHMKLNDDQIIEALSIAHGPEMRLEIMRFGEVTVINDAYNANPASTRAALETLAALPCDGRRIAVLGDMRELGEEAVRLHLDMGRFVANPAVRPHLLICVGAHAELIANEARRCGFPHEQMLQYDDTSAAAENVPPIFSSGDLVLLKASRSVQFEKIVHAMGAEPIRKTA